MEYKPNIKTVLKRYKAFWQKESYDRPPIRIRYPKVQEVNCSLLTRGSFIPDELQLLVDSLDL